MTIKIFDFYGPRTFFCAHAGEQVIWSRVRLQCDKEDRCGHGKANHGSRSGSGVPAQPGPPHWEALSDMQLTICEVACKVGFSTQIYFSTVFKSKFALTPSEYRERKKGEMIKSVPFIIKSKGK
jgi:AraC-like DNA-binding protein